MLSTAYLSYNNQSPSFYTPTLLVTNDTKIPSLSRLEKKNEKDDTEKEYKLTTQKKSEMAREKMWSRIHLIPLLQAEEDRDLVRRHLADQAREKELLGKNFKVYNSDRYVFFLFTLRQSLGKVYVELI